MSQQPHDIVLWGPSAAGKTMLVAQLYLQSVRHQGDWEILPTPESGRFISDMRQAIGQRNVFPEQTPIDHTDQIVYRFRNGKTGQTATLSIEDRAGRHYETLEEGIRRRLGEADGLMLLFDPLRDRETLKREVTRTLESIYVALESDGIKDERPYAVCLSKADTLLESADDFRQAEDDPQGFVERRIAPDLVAWLEKFSNNFRLFPVSSVGVRLNQEDLEPVVFFDENLNMRLTSDSRPLNLIQPFIWLLDQLERSS